jgi:hypothetical protein
VLCMRGEGGGGGGCGGEFIEHEISVLVYPTTFV